MIELIIGYGEIGQAVKQSVALDAFTYDIQDEQSEIAHASILHICFPYSDTFVEDVQDYIRRYNPLHIIIWSTVPIGTTKQIDDRAVHSPVEGVHSVLGQSIMTMVRWLGVNDGLEGDFFGDYFHERNMEYYVVPDSDFTEFLKLRSTAKYGVNLVWTDYEAKVANEIGMPVELLKAFDYDYNELYKELGLPQYQRYLLDPPNGKIGGHCIRPNAELLDKQFPHSMLKQIKRMK